MKILVLCYEYPPIGGGGGRMAHNVGSALVRRGHSVCVQTVRMPDLPEQEVRDGVEIFRTSGFRRRADFCTVPEMFGYLATSFLPSLSHIREWRPDIVHAHFAGPTGALALACKVLTGVPYVLTAHLGDLPGGNPDQTGGLFRILNPFIRPIWRNAAGISASSSFAAGLAREAYSVEPRIILNGISMEGKAAGARPPSQPLELAAIGRFNPQKNFLWLVRALAGCQFPWRLSLIGDGSQRGEIVAAIRDAHLEDRVNLMGWVAESSMRDVLARADVLLMPSTSEGNPVAAIEALKQGVAVLGSDIGGLSDLISNGKNGFAVPIETPAIFQQKLAWLADHPEAVHAMKAASLEIAGRFDVENIAGGFEELLSESGGSGRASQPKG
jgi:glycosyltransferase involved in cell wall biosynthesis